MEKNCLGLIIGVSPAVECLAPRSLLDSVTDMPLPTIHYIILEKQEGNQGGHSYSLIDWYLTDADADFTEVSTGNPTDRSSRRSFSLFPLYDPTRFPLLVSSSAYV